MFHSPLTQKEIDAIIGNTPKEHSLTSDDADEGDSDGGEEHKYRIFQYDSPRSLASRNFKATTSLPTDRQKAGGRLSPTSNVSFKSGGGNSSNHSYRSEVRDINNSTLHMMNKAKKKIDKDR